MTTGWVIWSFEHRAWWRGGMSGYTGELMTAGVYDFEDAKAICERANIGVVKEAMLPWPDWSKVSPLPARITESDYP